MTRDTITLSRQDCPAWPTGLVAPRYAMREVRAGIVHLGLGGFHRAHMARYTHDLMEQDDTAAEWGIAGVGMRPSDAATCAALTAQGGLYTLVEREGDAEQATVIGSVLEAILAPSAIAPLLDHFTDPTIRIISLTITENGYCLDRATRQLDETHPAIVADLGTPDRPTTAIGMIVEAARSRRDRALPPFTALSCDNIQHNGHVLRDAVLRFAKLRDPGLADWIGEHIAFPNTMVDRITPVPTAQDEAWMLERFGVIDRAPVVSELFRQWVIEDRFVSGRPAWEKVGAQFATDVAPYEMMKLRLLNASHLAIAALGQLAGHVFVHEAMGQPVFRRYMQMLMDQETGPTLPNIPGVDLNAYKRNLIARFANPRIEDTLQRVCRDAPLNVLIDPIRDRLQAGGRCELMALALAGWMRRLRGADDAGAPLTIDHPMADRLRKTAAAGGNDPRALLSIRTLFGELEDFPDFVTTVGNWLSRLDTAGAQTTLDQLFDTDR